MDLLGSWSKLIISLSSILQQCTQEMENEHIALHCILYNCELIFNYDLSLFLFLGEIRCYCDAPNCVATGYMCKSELSACFSRLLDPQNTNSPLTHGCLDTISVSVNICHAKGARNRTGLWPMLECCYDDMCNYRGLQDVLSHPRSEISGKKAAWSIRWWQTKDFVWLVLIRLM